MRKVRIYPKFLRTQAAGVVAPAVPKASINTGSLALGNASACRSTRAGKPFVNGVRLSTNSRKTRLQKRTRRCPRNGLQSFTTQTKLDRCAGPPSPVLIKCSSPRRMVLRTVECRPDVARRSQSVLNPLCSILRAFNLFLCSQLLRFARPKTARITSGRTLS